MLPGFVPDPDPAAADAVAPAPMVLLPVVPGFNGSLGLVFRSALDGAPGETALLPVAADFSGSLAVAVGFV